MTAKTSKSGKGESSSGGSRPSLLTVLPPLAPTREPGEESMDEGSWPALLFAPVPAPANVDPPNPTPRDGSMHGSHSLFCIDAGPIAAASEIESKLEAAARASDPRNDASLSSWEAAALSMIAELDSRAEEALEEILPAGTMIGDYQIQEKIGYGGMGVVYSAIHPVIGKRVAIKVLHAHLVRDGLVTPRFLQEARAVNRIRHPNIVDIFAFGELSDGRQYFIMDFLSGRTLKARLAETPTLPALEAIAILLQICDALQAAHSEGIIHRDLKPDNIFLVDDKHERLVKLLDFGVAKLLSHEWGEQTGTGVFIGTPRYVSPEQCQGEVVDPRSDVYSLGVLMYLLFTGSVPFASRSAQKAIRAHLFEYPRDPRELRSMPDPLAEIIMQCLAKRPAQRPASMALVRSQLQEIEKLLEGLNGAAVPQPVHAEVQSGPATVVLEAGNERPPLSTEEAEDPLRTTTRFQGRAKARAAAARRSRIAPPIVGFILLSVFAGSLANWHAGSRGSSTAGSSTKTPPAPVVSVGPSAPRLAPDVVAKPIDESPPATPQAPSAVSPVAEEERHTSVPSRKRPSPGKRRPASKRKAARQGAASAGAAPRWDIDNPDPPVP